MAQSKQKGSSKPTDKHQRKMQQDNQPTRHSCGTCGGGNIPFKELQMVRTGKPGGHTVMVAHHKGCFDSTWSSAKKV